MKKILKKLCNRRDSFFRGNDGNRGFTLIEVIVTIAVFGIIGVLVSVIMINTVRGAKKAQLITIVRQNGQAALDQMSRTLRSANSLNSLTSPCSGSTTKSIAFTDLNNNPQSYTYVTDASGNGNIQDITPSDLFDGKSVNVQLVNNGIFTCRTGGVTNKYAPYIVDISFDLKPSNTALTSGPDGLASPIHFQTSVVMRNTGQ